MGCDDAMMGPYITPSPDAPGNCGASFPQTRRCGSSSDPARSTRQASTITVRSTLQASRSFRNISTLPCLACWCCLSLADRHPSCGYGGTRRKQGTRPP